MVEWKGEAPIDRGWPNMTPGSQLLQGVLDAPDDDDEVPRSGSQAVADFATNSKPARLNRAGNAPGT